MIRLKLYFAAFIIGISLLSSANGQEVLLKELVQRNGLYYRSLSPTPYSGKVHGKKTGYLKNGRWDGPFIEIDENINFELSGFYKNGVRVGEWKYSMKKQFTTLSIIVDYKNGTLNLDKRLQE